ncbi:SHD1 domain-containing protein [Stieleria sp.]|uniref:SHD1 domain-containing protein n=1 Tax=Stieleria sp. TaxID=2795976 RepID=UPI003561E137
MPQVDRRTVVVLALLVCLCPVIGHAQSDARLWTDKTGKFQVSAKLIEHNETQVKLQKSDGRVITVPLNILSPADAKFVRELDAEPVNPFAGGEPMTPATPDRKLAPSPSGSFPQRSTTEELPTDGTEIYINVDETMPAVQPDPGVGGFQFAEFARPIEQLDAYARVSQPILVDPAVPVFAVSTHRNGNAVSPAHFGHVFLTTKGNKQPKLAFESDETFLLLDHNIAYDRSVAMIGVDSPSDRGGDLAVMDGLSNGSPRVVARWHLPEWQKPGFKPKAEFATMLDGTRALVQVNSSIYCWSLDDGKCHFLIQRVPATGKVAVSAGGRFLAISVSGGTQMIDVASAELIGKIPFPGTLTPEVRFSPDGSRLAMAAGNQVAVWNLQSAGMEMEETVETPIGRLVGWVGDDALLSQFALIDLEMAQAVWKYHLPSGGKEMTFPGGFVCIDKNARPAMITSLPLPHGAIAKVKQQLKNAGNDMLLLGPGGKVSLEVSGIKGVDEQVMEDALREAVEKAGWNVVPNADIKVVATITRGEKQVLNYRPIGASFRSEGETVNLKPYRASLKVVQGDTTLWQRSSENMVPFIIRLNAGESIKHAVKRYEKADPEYFKRVNIPPKIIKPEHRSIVGTSRIQNGRWVDF